MKTLITCLWLSMEPALATVPQYPPPVSSAPSSGHDRSDLVPIVIGAIAVILIVITIFRMHKAYQERQHKILSI